LPIIGTLRIELRETCLMSTRLAIVILAALAATVPLDASAQNSAAAATSQPAPSWSALSTYTGTIVQVDTTARVVTTRSASGRTSVFEAPPSMASSQLAAFKPGEMVTVTFYDGIDVRPRAAGGAAAAATVDPSTGLRTANVRVTAINPAARTVTFIGPRGEYTRTVPPGVDTSMFKTLVIGERAELSYFEYVQSMTRTASPATAAPVVEPPAAPTTAASESLRDRLTLYAFYGVDNQFSGKMIEAATGRTTGGVPINLEETTYDEVYGRMAMLKVGIGYRHSERLESAINFIYSNSDAAFEAVQIGTAGTSPQVPLNVHFTSYQYWGVEAGQRLFFPHGIVTPFAGWLVGLNRNQDIRGTFVGVPPNALPGLAAQDGKFFERSWAFSVGPTGGILIGRGSVQAIGETQLRFLGGLSDVDWLVEEGLRDINSKSSRWSVPFLAGVRVKF